MSAFIRTRRTRESGFALVTVLIALALVTTVGVALTGIGAVEYRTSLNHRSATRALLLADAGATHAVALMRGPLSPHEYSEILKGSDGLWNTSDDGYLMGFDLAGIDVLPDTGMATLTGRYSVQIINDPGDPSGDPSIDDNHQVIAVCRGETADGGAAEIQALLAARSFPAIATNGDLVLPGIPVITGDCAGIHANGDLTVSGNPTVDGSVSATGDVIQSGTITDSDGYVVTPTEDEPPVFIPEYDPFEYCNAATHVLTGGSLITLGEPPDTVAANGSKPLGWQHDGATNTYKLFPKDAVEGHTYCVDGNVLVNGSLGSSSDPFEISLLADGSVQLNGTPVIEATHPEDILIMATGDVQAGGNSSGGTPFYSGLIYSGAQCKVNGNPVINGHLLCHDGVNLSGHANLTDENKVNGNPTITYDCTGFRQRTEIVAWWEVRAQ